MLIIFNYNNNNKILNFKLIKLKHIFEAVIKCTEKENEKGKDFKML